MVIPISGNSEVVPAECYERHEVSMSNCKECVFKLAFIAILISLIWYTFTPFIDVVKGLSRPVIGMCTSQLYIISLGQFF